MAEKEQEELQLSQEGTFTDLKDKTLLEEVIERVVKKKGYEHIKANLPGYEQPTSFTNADDGNKLIPDVTAQRFGRKSYFEISIKNDQKQKVVNKWKLINGLAKAQDGKFHLIAPRGSYAFTKRICDEYNIDANIIKF